MLEDELKAQLAVMGAELDRRMRRSGTLEGYYTGSCPLPAAITAARVTRSYRMLMGLAQAPWGNLIVDSVQDRLEVTGLRDVDDSAASALWDVWQRNQMDAESKLAHNAALIDGRAYALVWPDAKGNVEISLDNQAQMIVMYRDGSRRHAIAALRRWVEGRRPMATLYRPDGIYKFEGPKNSSGAGGTQWQRRDVPDEVWPVPNPFAVVPAVELRVNPRLKPGGFPYARGEFEHSTGLIDRIHTLTFLGLVVAFWMGFPVRAVIGDKILRDDDNNPIAPFKAMANEVVQLENPSAKLDQFDAADRRNLSIFAELDQLATVTKTPRHYFPLEGGMSNLSADAIRASEGGLVAKVPNHKASVGEGWEQVLRLAGLMSPDEIVLSPGAEIQWADHETRSLAERADAASKLVGSGFPWQLAAEKALKLTAGEIARAETARAGDAIGQLVAQLNAPTAPPAPAAAPVG